MSMEIAAPGLLAITLGAMAGGLATYAGVRTKIAKEVHSATEALKRTVESLGEKNRSMEVERERLAAAAALESDRRKAFYAYALSAESLIHAMFWLSSDAKARGKVRPDLVTIYDNEAHKHLPEIFSQLALLSILDKDFHARAYPCGWRLAGFDAKFGAAIVLAAQDEATAAQALGELFPEIMAVQFELDALFGGTPSEMAAGLAGATAA